MTAEVVDAAPRHATSRRGDVGGRPGSSLTHACTHAARLIKNKGEKLLSPSLDDRRMHAWMHGRMDPSLGPVDARRRLCASRAAVGAGRQPCGAGRRGGTAARHDDGAGGGPPVCRPRGAQPRARAILRAPIPRPAAASAVRGRRQAAIARARSASPVSDGSPRCEPQICTLYLVLVRADADATPKATSPLVTHDPSDPCMHLQSSYY